jgi:hypothetical protein
VQALPSILQLLFALRAPESPRWLVSKGRDQEAIKTLAYYHADGDERDPLVRFEYEEIKAALAYDSKVAGNVGYKSLFTTAGNLKRMRIIAALAVFSQWRWVNRSHVPAVDWLITAHSGNNLISNYLDKVFTTIGITDTTVKLVVNGVLAVWNFAWACAAALSVERLGRRFLFLAAPAGMFLWLTAQTFCAAQYAQHASKGAAYGVVLFIFLFYAHCEFVLPAY